MDTTRHPHLLRRLLILPLGLLLVLGACKLGGPGSQAPGGRGKAQAAVPAGPRGAGSDGKAWPAPPPPTAPRPVNFPDIDSFRLGNELVVYVVENHEVPIVSAQLVARCGAMDDEHLSGLTALMLGEGTRSRSKAKIDEAIEFVGGSLFATTGMHASTVHARSLKGDLKLAMLLMADEIQNPTFSPAALEKLKQRQKAAVRVQRAQPDVLAETLLHMLIYPEGHPYGRALPTGAEIDAVTVGAVREFHQTFYRPNNSFLILSGDITAAEAKPLVERAFAGWSAAAPRSLPPNPLNTFTRYELPGELTVHVVDRPGSTQTEIRVGNLAVARNHEDWVELQVANAILGSGPTGRLFQDIREERGLTYGIYSSVDGMQAPGTFIIETNTRTPTTGEMLAAIFEHIDRIRNEDPTRDEFETVVRMLIGAFPLEVETPDQIVSKLREQLIFGLSEGYWRSYRDALTHVELSRTRQAAQKYIHAIPVVVVVGSADQIEPQIKRVLPTAKIRVYDDGLKPKK